MNNWEKLEVKHKVKEITFDEAVSVLFADGHKAIFWPYRHGWGYQVEGLRHFMLYKGEKEVFVYKARLYYTTLQEDEYKIVKMSKGYSQESVAAYWKSAYAYISNLFRSDDYDKWWYPWIVISQGGLDLARLEKGEASMAQRNEIVTKS